MHLKLVGVLLLVPLVALIDAQDRIELRKIAEYSGAYRGSFSRDGAKLALLDVYDLRVIDIRTGKTICQVAGHNDTTEKARFTAAIFSPNDKTIAINGYTFRKKDATVAPAISIYQIDTCKEVLKLENPSSGRVGNQLAFSSDGHMLSGSAGSSRIWDISTSKEIFKYSPDEDYLVNEALMSPDGRWLVSYAEKFVPPKNLGRLFVTDLKTKETRLLCSDWILHFTFSNDMQQLVINIMGRSKNNPNIKIYDTKSWKIINEFWSDSAGRTFALSPDGKLLAGGDESPFYITSAADGIVMGKADHYKRTKADDLAGRMHMITFLDYVEFSPDGKMLLTGGEDDTVKLWKIEFK